MAQSFSRAAISDFSIGRPRYAGATVAAYAVDATGNSTTTLVPLYADLVSAAKLQNPQTLDGEGKWQQPVYVDQPVVLKISGVDGLADHQTGVIAPNLAGDAAAQAATSAAAAQGMLGAVSDVYSRARSLYRKFVGLGFPLSLTGKALNFIRVVAGETGYEFLTPSAALTALGGQPVDADLTAIAVLDPAAGDAGKALIATGTHAWALAGPVRGLKNLLINADFSVNQRAYVSGTATTGANQYTLDRWRVVTSGQNLTLAAAGRGNTVTAPAGGLEQVIEAANVEGGTYTLSWTGTATATVNGSAVANGATVVLPANTNATVRFTGGTVSKAQLELGSVATAFDFRPAAAELALCQRYFQTITASILGNAAGAGLGNGYSYVFPVPMRATPTLTGPTGGTQSNVTAGAFDNPSATQFRFAITSVTAAGVYAWTSATGTASAEL